MFRSDHLLVWLFGAPIQRPQQTIMENCDEPREVELTAVWASRRRVRLGMRCNDGSRVTLPGNQDLACIIELLWFAWFRAVTFIIVKCLMLSFRACACHMRQGTFFFSWNLRCWWINQANADTYLFLTSLAMRCPDLGNLDTRRATSICAGLQPFMLTPCGNVCGPRLREHFHGALGEANQALGSSQVSIRVSLVNETNEGFPDSLARGS